MITSQKLESQFLDAQNNFCGISNLQGFTKLSKWISKKKGNGSRLQG
jgi:hypothetical protein